MIQQNINDTQHNSSYYNQLLRDAERKRGNKRKEKKDFASQEVDLTRYLLIPKGYEEIAYIFYFITLPYITGLTFLFFYVASGAYTNFVLLDLTSFLIIWMIGYEIMGSIILFFIFLSYLKYLKG